MLIEYLPMKVGFYAVVLGEIKSLLGLEFYSSCLFPIGQLAGFEHI